MTASASDYLTKLATLLLEDLVAFSDDPEADKCTARVHLENGTTYIAGDKTVENLSGRVKSVPNPEEMLKSLKKAWVMAKPFIQSFIREADNG